MDKTLLRELDRIPGFNFVEKEPHELGSASINSHYNKLTKGDYMGKYVTSLQKERGQLNKHRPSAQDKNEDKEKDKYDETNAKLAAIENEIKLAKNDKKTVIQYEWKRLWENLDILLFDKEFDDN